MVSSRIAITMFLASVTACTGADGISDLTDVNPEAAGANCPSGGVAITSGADTNGDGVLNGSEITSTEYVCSGGNGSNGTNGTNGINGISTLSNVTPEPAGANCAAGGAQIDTGADVNRDQVLQAGEITSTTYVCGAGAAQIIKVAQTGTVVAANTNAAVTVLSAQITTVGAGKLLAISNVDAYCATAECPAGNPAADGYLWMSLVNNEASPPLDTEYFFLTPNTTEAVSRTQDFTIGAATTATVYLRGKDSVASFSFYRPSITLIFLP